MVTESSTLNPDTIQQRRMKFAVQASIIAAVVAALLTFLAVPPGDLPIFQAGTINVATAFVAATLLVSVIVTAIGFRKFIPVETEGSLITRLAGRLAASLAVGALLAGLCALVFYILYNAFIGVVIDRWLVILLIGGYSALLAFVVGFFSSRLTTAQLFFVGVAALVVGVALAMAAVTNPEWWTISISYLGAQDSSQMLFNAALILCGLILICVIGDIVADLRIMRDDGRITNRIFNLMRTVLYIAGIMLTSIGIFKSDIDTWTYWPHQIAANGFFGIVIGMQFIVPRLLRTYPKWFQSISLAFGVASIALAALWLVFGVLDFVIFEIIVVGVSLVWFLFFLIATERAARGNDAPLFKLSHQTQIKMNYALAIGLIGACAAGAFTLFATYHELLVPITAENTESFASILIRVCAVLTLVVCASTYRHFSSTRDEAKRISFGSRLARLLNRIVFSLAMTLLAIFVSMIAVFILQNLFPGKTISSTETVLIMCLVGFLLSAVLALFASTVNTFMIFVVTAALAATGLLWAATNATSPNWWQNSISFLSHDETGSTAFRVTLILVGLLWIAAIEDIGIFYRIAIREGTITVRTYRWLMAFLYLIGLCIVGVGIFPTVVSPLSDLLHNIFATGFSLIFLVFTFAILRLAPFYPSWFQQGSRLIGIIIIGGFIVFYGFSLISFVGLELLIIISMAVWVAIFWNATRDYFASRETVLVDTPPADVPRTAI